MLDGYRLLSMAQRPEAFFMGRLVFPLPKMSFNYIDLSGRELAMFLTPSLPWQRTVGSSWPKLPSSEVEFGDASWSLICVGRQWVKLTRRQPFSIPLLVSPVSVSHGTSVACSWCQPVL